MSINRSTVIECHKKKRLSDVTVVHVEKVVTLTRLSTLLQPYIQTELSKL